LPPEVTYLSDTSGGDYNSVTGVWTVGNVPFGTSQTIIISVTVNAGTGGGLVENMAAITAATTPDPDLTNNDDTGSFTIPTVDVDVNKSVAPPEANVGDIVTYSIDVMEDGLIFDATGVVGIDSLPAGVVNNGVFTVSQGTFNHITGVWIIGTILAGQTAELDFEAVIQPGFAGTFIENTFTITSLDQEDTDPTNNMDDSSFFVKGADLSVDKTDNPDPVLAGNQLVYTVTVNNAGPSDADNVQVTDTLPAGVTFVSTTGCAEDPNGVPTCTLGIIPAGGSDSYTITVTVDATLQSGTILTNNVEVTSDTEDLDNSNNTDTEDTLVNLEADLEILKSDNPDPVLAGCRSI